MFNLIKLGKYMHTLYNFWFAENVLYFGLIYVFLLLNPLNFKGKHSDFGLQYFGLLACKKIPKTRITREQKNSIFWLIKNEDKIASDHLKMYFYYIKKNRIW